MHLRRSWLSRAGARLAPIGKSGRFRFSSPLVLFVALFVLFSAAAASAYFVESDSGEFALATAGQIGPPTSFTATPATPTTVTLSWSAPTDPSPTGYTLSQSPGTLAGCSTSPDSSTTSCSATGLTPGTSYTWTIEADYFSWTSTSAQMSQAPLKMTPTISTTASPAHLTVGGSVDDQATMSGGSDPGGSITFSLYSSTDTHCTAALFISSSQSVNGDSTYTSSSFETDEVGSYIWGFSYSGDSANSAVTGCGGTGEALTVDPAAPNLTTLQSTTVSSPRNVADNVLLSDGFDPTGTITYSLYGPSAGPSCTTQIGQVTTTVDGGNGFYSSPTIPVSSPGTYWWIASYGGDSNNESAANLCGGVVSPYTPDVKGSADPAAIAHGGSAADQAEIAGGFSPTGTITFSLYPSSDTSCSGTPLFSSTQSVNGNSTYTSNSYAPASGTYLWGLGYGGDLNNYGVDSCGGPGQTLTVS